jgi:[acyl-carrier-protein] S-malonyltransferase
MSDARIILCPGQGAQAVGMGRAWARASPEARRVFDRADEVLGDRLGAPLSEICFEGPAETLNRTDVCQPGLYVCGIASLAGLCAGRGVTPSELPLGATAGLSLGEYTALHVAGAVGFEDGLELVTLRGRAMQDAAEAVESGMVALVGSDGASAQAVCDEALEAGPGGEVLVCANFNAIGQVVISGHKTACERAVPIAEAKGLKPAVLAVAGAFHSPLMRPAAERLREKLEGIEIRQPRCRVWSNVTGRPHQDSADSVRDLLVRQLTSPVRWADCCRGVVSNAEGALHELAPGRTLAGLMRRIDRSHKVESHDEP